MKIKFNDYFGKSACRNRKDPDQTQASVYISNVVRQLSASELVMPNSRSYTQTRIQDQVENMLSIMSQWDLRLLSESTPNTSSYVGQSQDSSLVISYTILAIQSILSTALFYTGLFHNPAGEGDRAKETVHTILIV